MEDQDRLNNPPVAFEGMSTWGLAFVIIGTATMWGMIIWGVVWHIFL